MSLRNSWRSWAVRRRLLPQRRTRCAAGGAPERDLQPIVTSYRCSETERAVPLVAHHVRNEIIDCRGIELRGIREKRLDAPALPFREQGRNR